MDSAPIRPSPLFVQTSSSTSAGPATGVDTSGSASTPSGTSSTDGAVSITGETPDSGTPSSFSASTSSPSSVATTTSAGFTASSSCTSGDLGASGDCAASSDTTPSNIGVSFFSSTCSAGLASSLGFTASLVLCGCFSWFAFSVRGVNIELNFLKPLLKLLRSESVDESFRDLVLFVEDIVTGLFPEFNNLDAQRLTGLQCVDRDAALAFALAVVGEGE
mmetsp:Transcript_7086/g.12862  ORF Transcript_7086/g.12862 Transcript_7086/m.12862 type:complete len:219 (-) Transcript_7086:5-661(-)